jgi:hypothetical protein
VPAESDRSASRGLPIDALLLAVLFAWLIGFGAAAAVQAARRRRNPVWWAVLGAILGPVALLILHRAPPGRCASCAARTMGWSTICAWCGEDVWGAPAPAAASASTPARTQAAPSISALAAAAAAAERDARPAPAPVPEPQPAIAAPTPLTVIQGSRGTTQQPTSQRATDSAADSVEAPAATAGTAGPVHRLRAVLGSSAAAAEVASQAAQPRPMLEAADPDLEAREVVLASAIYVTGTRGLQAGSRYGIALIGTNLGIMGPVDVDPSAIVVHRPLRGLDATGASGQLIITADDGFRGKFAMVFMALAGGTPERVAEIIVTAASGEAMAR